MWNKLLVLCALLLQLCKHSESYFVVVDAHSEECFFDRVEAGTKMGESIAWLKIRKKSKQIKSLIYCFRCHV